MIPANPTASDVHNQVETRTFFIFNCGINPTDGYREDLLLYIECCKFAKRNKDKRRKYNVSI